jgi:CRISPR/Cas system-associated exonuclease Cas4 (RecB family)
MGWHEATKPRYLAQEVVVHADDERYSGTIDMLTEIDGELWVIDIKTSKSLHPEYEAQVGAYAYAFSPYMFNTKQIKAGILHLGNTTKKGWSFKEVDVQKGFEVFKACTNLFYLLNENPQPKFVEYPLLFNLNQND